MAEQWEQQGSAGGDEHLSETALSLEEQIARLQALLEASRQVHSSIAVGEVLERTARLLVRELEFDGVVFHSPAGVELAQYGSPEDATVAVPLTARDGTALATLSVTTGRALGLYERDFLDGLVLQAEVALENATYHERDLEWARVQQDLDAARGIQRSLFPRTMPELEGLTLAARSVACYEVGGDYLDVLRLPDGSTLLVVADVAGKGLASAIMATSFRAAFRSLAAQDIPLAELATRVGQLHWDEGNEARRRYVTAILVRIPCSGVAGDCQLEAVNAGHNPGLVLAPDGAVYEIGASGTPLGLLPGMQYTAEQVPFPAGARLLLYTDGLTEVFHGEEEFGPERLADTLRSLRDRDATGVLDGIWERLDAFSSAGAAARNQTDDMTAFVVTRD